MGLRHSIILKNNTIHGISNAMDRKNVNRGFKKLRVWQDAVSLYVLACNIFVDFPFEYKKWLPIASTQRTAFLETLPKAIADAVSKSI
jgi:hypothetical protein